MTEELVGRLALEVQVQAHPALEELVRLASEARMRRMMFELQTEVAQSNAAQLKLRGRVQLRLRILAQSKKCHAQQEATNRRAGFGQRELNPRETMAQLVTHPLPMDHLAKVIGSHAPSAAWSRCCYREVPPRLRLSRWEMAERSQHFLAGS